MIVGMKRLYALVTVVVVLAGAARLGSQYAQARGEYWTALALALVLAEEGKGKPSTEDHIRDLIISFNNAGPVGARRDGRADAARILRRDVPCARAPQEAHRRGSQARRRLI